MWSPFFVFRPGDFRVTVQIQVQPQSSQTNHQHLARWSAECPDGTHMWRTEDLEYQSIQHRTEKRMTARRPSKQNDQQRVAEFLNMVAYLLARHHLLSSRDQTPVPEKKSSNPDREIHPDTVGIKPKAIPTPALISKGALPPKTTRTSRKHARKPHSKLHPAAPTPQSPPAAPPGGG